MPPKVTDTRTAQNEALHKVEEKTAAGARRIVATFAEDFYDAVTLMCMLGVEKEGLSFKKVHEEYEKEHAPKTTKRTRKSTKKTAKKSSKKAAKKSTRKSTKKAAKKATRKAAKKTTKKAAKKATKKAAN
ncbi:MAG: hypothetical protein Q4E11_08575 [Corynebacterium sp.]|uniref:hypothetical protein n=1 Tax=Corynebacterium sp. TaxID=1720 RepID=UPI0026DBC512|nr:hypothetical protein [Corynebacterium sp.]MDO5030621.1 hypothetical protein [Corynebacterium sp.]